MGGLGSIVSTILADEGLAVRFKILGIPDRFVPMAHAPYLYHQFCLDTDGIKRTMINLLEGVH